MTDEDAFQKAVKQILGDRSEGLGGQSLDLLRSLWDGAIDHAEEKRISPQLSDDQFLDGFAFVGKYHKAWQEMNQETGLRPSQPRGNWNRDEWDEYNFREHEATIKFRSHNKEPLCEYSISVEPTWIELSKFQQMSVKNAEAPLKFVVAPLELLTTLRQIHMEHPHTDQVRLPVDEQPIYCYLFGIPFTLPFWLERTIYGVHLSKERKWQVSRMLY